MKTNLKFFVVLAAGIFMMTACNNQQTQNTENNAENIVEATVLEVDDVLAQADSLAGQEITLHGVCTHTCQHGATKIFLMGSDDTKTIRVEACKLGSFSQDCVNNIVKVTGVLVEDRIDEAYLQNWEEQNRNQTAEKHGEGEGGCSTEKNARGETGNTVEQRIADFRARIAAEKEKTGKEYLSFYHIDAIEYEIEQ